MTGQPSRSPLPPSRGEIWMASLEPVRGHEQGGERPCLIVSADPFNRGPSGLTVMLPLTTRDRGLPMHVPVLPPEGGVRLPSLIMCDQVRTVARERLGQRLGAVTEATMTQVEQRLRRLLRL